MRSKNAKKSEGFYQGGKEKKISDLLVSRNTALRDVMEVINKHGGMTALVVDDNLKLLGIITDGDIRRALLKYGRLDLKAADVMQKKFHFVKNDINRILALDMMKALGVNQLPVLDSAGRVIALHTYYSLLGLRQLSVPVLIMAGGKGLRLRPITGNIPKPMVKVAGRPILEHIILHLVSSGLQKIYIAVNYLGQVIEEYFGDGSAHACQIQYVREKEPLGTAGALSLFPEKHKETILVMNGDLITQFDAWQMIALHERNNNTITIGAYNYTHQVPYGVLNVRKNRVVEIIEKPIQCNLINGGIYVLDGRVIKDLPKNKKIDMTELIVGEINKKRKVGFYSLEGDWTDIGRHSELAIARGMQ